MAKYNSNPHLRPGMSRIEIFSIKTEYEKCFMKLKKILEQKGLEKELEKFNRMSYDEKCAAVDRFVKAGIIRWGLTI